MPCQCGIRCRCIDIICEMCLCAVHQTCYGRELAEDIPINDWFCQRCQYIIDHTNNDTTIRQMINKIKCDLCHKYKGCIVNVKSDLYQWVHHTCVNWIPELYFDDESDFTDVIGKVDKDRKDLRCSLCRQKNGYCIQCDYKNCVTSFHVPCAMEANLIKDWNYCQDIAKDDDIPVFCKKHEKAGFREFTKGGSNAIQADFQEINQKRKNQEIRLQNIENGTDLPKKKIQHVMLKFNDDDEDDKNNDEDDEDEENYEINNEELKEVNDEDRRPRPKSKSKNSKRKRLVKNNQKVQESILGQDQFNPALFQTINSMITNNAGNKEDLLQRLSNFVNNQLGKKKSRSKSKSAVNVQPQMAQVNNVQNVERHNNVARKQTRSNGVQQPKGSNKNKNGKKKQSNVTNTQQTSLIDPNAQYFVHPSLAQFIGINKGKMKEINLAFIEYALSRKLVDSKSHSYEIFKDYQLRAILNTDRFKSSELNRVLFPFVSKEVLYEENKGSGPNNFNNAPQNGYLDNLDNTMDESQSRNSRLLRKKLTQKNNSDNLFDLDIIDPNLVNNLRGVDQQVSRHQGPSSSRIQQVGVRNQRKQVVPTEAQNPRDEYSNLTKDELIALLKRRKN